MNNKHQNLLQTGIDVQKTEIPAKTLLANAGATSIMSLFKVPINTMLLVDVTLFAKGTTTTRAAYRISALLKNTGGTVALVSTVVAPFTAEDTAAWAATLVANDTKKTVDLQVTPDTALNTTFWGYASAQAA